MSAQERLIRIALDPPPTSPSSKSRPVTAMSDEFWSQVSKSDGCWEWRGPVSPDGYGRTTVDGVRWFTHRYAYTVQRGEIPAGLVIDHLCRNRR
ncbi:HNH endonuclease, partial [Tsukamurella ocularis]